MANYHFSMVPNRAISDLELSHAAFRLLALIATHRNQEDGWSWPGRKLLAKEMGYGGRDDNAIASVTALAKDLAAKGYIDYIPGNGRTSSHYRVIYDAPRPILGEGEDTPLRGGLEAQGEGGLSPPQTRKLNNKTKKDISSDEGFAAFYDTYPRKEGKGQAEKAYRSALKFATHHEIMRGLVSQISALYAKEAKYRKLPSTWLNGKCWLDEQPKDPEPQSAMRSWL